MTDFLVKLLIKNSEMVHNSSVRKKYGMLSGTTGIILNLLLACGKFLAGTAVSSIAITADAFNNLSDAASSLVTLIGFKMAGAPNDKGHPFGHGRIEYLSGLLVSLIIMLAGIELIKSSIGRIIAPTSMEFNIFSITVLSVSICVKLWMYFFNRRLADIIGSAAMQATARDSLSDSIATGTVLLGSLFGYFYHLRIDGYLGILVALFILYTGFTSARDTLNPLLGQPPGPEFVADITHTVLSHPEIVGIHDLIVHDYGPGRAMLSLHAEVPSDANILEMHDVIDVTERELKQKFDCDAVIHMDPIVTNDEHVTAMHEKVIFLVKNIDPALSVHDFRMVHGSTHTNLIFDVVVPHRYYLTNQQVITAIQTAVKTLDENYYAVIEVDNFFL